MNRLYERNRLAFALVWIGVYVLGFSIADGASEALGMEKCITAPLCLAMSAFLWLWLGGRKLRSHYGLCAFRGDWKKYLYFLPLALMCSVNLWNGLQVNLRPTEAALYVLTMLGVGFLEEVIFRGFLYRALEEQGNHWAIWISGVTFGFGHIVNLLNGAALLPTLLQLVYATAAGLLFTIIFFKSGSLLPCIITHSILNALSVFSVESGGAADTLTSLVLAVITAAYALWIWKKCPKRAE